MYVRSKNVNQDMILCDSGIESSVGCQINGKIQGHEIIEVYWNNCENTSVTYL